MEWRYTPDSRGQWQYNLGDLSEGYDKQSYGPDMSSNVWGVVTLD